MARRRAFASKTLEATVGRRRGNWTTGALISHLQIPLVRWMGAHFIGRTVAQPRGFRRRAEPQNRVI
jgi:hypothetical protein